MHDFKDLSLCQLCQLHPRSNVNTPPTCFVFYIMIRIPCRHMQLLFRKPSRYMHLKYFASPCSRYMHHEIIKSSHFLPASLCFAYPVFDSHTMLVLHLYKYTTKLSTQSIASLWSQTLIFAGSCKLSSLHMCAHLITCFVFWLEWYNKWYT